MQIAILGFGLIGGSLARALRRQSALNVLGERPTIVAWSPTGHGPERAVGDGTVDRAAETIDDGIAGTDLIVLAAPPLACLALIDELASSNRRARPGSAIVTDVASTKGRIVAAADARGLRFVGGHPLAGRESNGYGAATDDLFDDRPWVVIPGRHAERGDVAVVERVARAAGARTMQLTAAAHDDAVAAISHLPLVLSAALAEAMIEDVEGVVRLDWPTAASLAATGWQSMTRLARGDVEMGAGIAATNAVAIAERLRDLGRVLDEWLVALDSAASDAQADRLADPFRERLQHAHDRLTERP